MFKAGRRMIKGDSQIFGSCAKNYYCDFKHLPTCQQPESLGKTTMGKHVLITYLV